MRRAGRSDDLAERAGEGRRFHRRRRSGKRRRWLPWGRRNCGRLSQRWRTAEQRKQDCPTVRRAFDSHRPPRPTELIWTEQAPPERLRNARDVGIKGRVISPFQIAVKGSRDLVA